MTWFVQERMPREMAIMLEGLTPQDLHWRDHARLDLIVWLARRRELARLMLVGTYRPVEVILRSHPLTALK